MYHKSLRHTTSSTPGTPNTALAQALFQHLLSAILVTRLYVPLSGCLYRDRLITELYTTILPTSSETSKADIVDSWHYKSLAMSSKCWDMSPADVSAVLLLLHSISVMTLKALFRMRSKRLVCLTSTSISLPTLSLSPGLLLKVLTP